jgi:choline kinase
MVRTRRQQRPAIAGRSMTKGIDKAVILAAGSGSRLSQISGGRPKPLMPLNGTLDGPCFLDWHVAALGAMDVTEIIIVGNSQTYGWRSAYADYDRVRWIFNPKAATTGSGHSLWHATTEEPAILDGRSRVLMMDADILYDPAILTRLAAASDARSKILVASQFENSGEEVLVFARDGQPQLQGKGLFGTELVADFDCLGEATGILLFEPVDHPLVASAIAWSMRFSVAGERSEHEDILQHVMSVGRLSAFGFADRPFLEVDTPTDYERLVEQIYPQLAALVFG